MPFIMVTVFIDMLSIGLIVPVLPALVGGFTPNQAEQAYWYGVVAFAFGLANFFGAPILGALSDRYGRRPVLLMGFCGLALNFFATAMATALWMLIAVRLVGGAVQANAAIANAYVADITAPEDRARRFGQLGAMFGIGFILGPVLGGVLGDIDLRLPFLVAGCCAMANLLYGVFVLPESLPNHPPSRRSICASLNPARLAPRVRATARHRAAAVGDGGDQPRDVRDVHHLGAVHDLPASAGARARTAGHCSRWASRRRSYRASC